MVVITYEIHVNLYQNLLFCWLKVQKTCSLWIPYKTKRLALTLKEKYVFTLICARLVLPLHCDLQLSRRQAVNAVHCFRNNNMIWI